MADDARLQVVLEAKIDKLIDKLGAANKAVYGASSKMQKDIDAANAKWERMFLGGGPARAVKEVFSSASTSAIASGTAQLGAAGAAIGVLGPAGIAAAVGVAALAAAFVQARAASEFADDLDDTAKRLHVTTDALQEYRYAIRLAGGEEKGADEALESFSITLGRAQAGIPKALKAFQMLGFSKDQVKSFADVDTALKAVTGRIEGLGKTQQKDAVVSMLGLDGLKPLIEDGVAEMERLRDEAQKIGIVMDADLIKKGAEAKDQFETLAKVIDVQVKSAFVGLAPEINTILGLIAKMVEGVADVVAGFQAIDERSDRALKRQLDALVRQNVNLATSGDRFADQPLIERNKKRIAEIQAQLAANEAKARPGPAAPKPTGRDLIDLQGQKDATDAARKAQERAARGAEAIDRAIQDELRARMNLVTGVMELEQLQLQEIDAELKRKNDKVNAEVAAGKMNRADADRVIALDKATADAERIAVARRTEADIAEDTLNSALSIARYYDEIDAIEGGMATSAKKRREIELRRLAARERLERKELDERQAQERVGKSGADLDAVLSKQRAETGAFNDLKEAQKRDVLFGTRGPLEQYLDTLKDVDDLVQSEAISAFRGLADSLGDATAKALGLKGPLGQLFGSIISLMLQRQGASLFGSLLGGLKIPGFASGTWSAPGGLATVGERGPELVNLPRGAQVLNGDMLRQLAGLQAQAGRSAVVQQITFDNRGAIIWEGEVARLMRYADGAAAQAAVGAYQMARRDIPAGMNSRAASRMGS